MGSDVSMTKISDSEMLDFMKATGASIVEDNNQVPDKVTMDALQADMLLYEQFTRPADLELLGWLDEFETSDKQTVTVAGASHYVHVEQPSEVAKVLLRTVS